MIQLSLPTRFAFKKGEGSYVHIFMFIGATIFLFHAFNILHTEKHTFLFYQNLIAGIIFFGNGLFLTITRKLKASINIGLALLFVIFSSLLLNGTSNPLSLIWIVMLPMFVFFSKEKLNGVFISVFFLIVATIILLLQHWNYITTPYSTPVYLELLAAYTVCFILTYMYKDIIVRRDHQIYHELNFCNLTNLPNRKKLIHDINKLNNSTLILINVDDFKIVNNLYGASNGDKILLEMSERLKTLYNSKHIYKTYKLHADEFALLILPDKDQHSTIDLVNNIISRISRNYSINEMDIAITVSIGVSSSSRDLLADADIALKTAKERRIPFVVYDGKYKITQQYQLNIDKLLQLKSAVLNDNIIPFFQPIIDNSDGSIHKYECLVRLIDGDEIMAPYQFLDISKKAKFYPDITRAMIKKSFDMFRDKEIQFSLNIDLDDILNKETTELIFSKLQDRKIAENVVFELLESNKIDEHQEVAAFILKVKSLGAKIAIDDFGSGYSNFEYVLKLNVDFIKIDASLIKNITEDRNSQIITETIVNFTKKLNIKTIAEFVHTEEVYRKVKELGIDYSQGYHLGKPDGNIKEIAPPKALA